METESEDVLAVGADVDVLAVAGSAALDDDDDDDDDVVLDSERVSIDSSFNLDSDSAFNSGVKWGIIPVSV